MGNNKEECKRLWGDIENALESPLHLLSKNTTVGQSILDKFKSDCDEYKEEEQDKQSIENLKKGLSKIQE